MVAAMTPSKNTMEAKPACPAGQPQSKRFITTARSAQDYILSQRHLLGDRTTIAKQLRAQKHQNTKTNLVFGFDTVAYESDAMTRQRDILSGGSYNPNRKKELADMKKELQKTNFSFGQDVPEYVPVSTLPDPTGHVHDYMGQLNTEVKRMIKKSNLYLGGDRPDYATNHTDFFQYRGLAPQDFHKRKREIAALKRELTSNTFTLGNDDTVHVSTYHETFNNGNIEALSGEEKARTRLRSKEIKKDLRHCHYVLGYDTADYRTTMMRQFEVPDAEKACRDREVFKEQAKALQQGLVSSSLCIGNDDDYM